MNDFFSELDELFRSGDQRKIEDFLRAELSRCTEQNREMERISVQHELAGFLRGTGRYRESMEERIDFTKNPNGVLNCGCFPLIRLASPLGNAVGSVKQIYLRGIYKGKAEVVSCDTLFLDEIRKAHAYLFMGEDTETVRKAIKRRYADRRGINWETQRVDFVVLRYVKEDNTLFKS